MKQSTNNNDLPWQPSRHVILRPLVLFSAVLAIIGGFFIWRSFAATNGSPDLNGDSAVNLTDLSILLSSYSKAGTAAQGDLNGDGTITLTDLSILLTAYGKPVTPGPASSTIYLGAAIEPEQLNDPAFTAALKKYKFDSLTPENAMKFAPLEGGRGQFNWSGADKIVNYAQANNMRVRGHTLVWHIEVPGWVNGLSNADASAALENHIKTVVGRYKGKIAEWDVVNEALNDDGSLRDTVWKQKLGNDYIAQAFKWAHEADPNAKLFYNEYSAESRDLDGNGGTGRAAKSDAVLAMVKDFKARGIPIDGVGLQTHSAGLYPGTGAAIKANIQRLAAVGVKSEITELDTINIGDETAKANRYGDIGKGCFDSSACTGITTWGLYDGHTWRGTAAAPLMLDTNYNAKASYFSLTKAIGR